MYGVGRLQDKFQVATIPNRKGNHVIINKFRCTYPLLKIRERSTCQVLTEEVSSKYPLTPYPEDCGLELHASCLLYLKKKNIPK
jgi:hypothetical protein